jgi:hypothetical protein
VPCNIEVGDPCLELVCLHSVTPAPSAGFKCTHNHGDGGVSVRLTHQRAAQLLSHRRHHFTRCCVGRAVTQNVYTRIVCAMCSLYVRIIALLWQQPTHRTLNGADI